MNEENKKELGAEGAPAPDRGIPSVAAASGNRKFLMAGMLLLAAAAITLVVIDDNSSKAAPSLVETEDQVFRSPALNAEPFIQTEPAAGPSAAAEQTLPESLPVPDPRSLEIERAMQAEALKMAREQQVRREQRLRSPQLIFDKNRGENPAGAITAAQAPTAISSSVTNSTALNGQLGATNVETASATQLLNLQALVAQGTMIAGILETAIQSDLPGMVRAIVSENVYSHDGTNILIPKGTRLIGQYKSGLVRGQTRVFVVWNRVLRQDGISVNIDSMGTDDLGRSGLTGELDTHFFERFGSSILLSMIDAGLQMGVNALDNRNSATVAMESGSDFSRSAEIALENSIAIPPTIHVPQGQKIKVFVAKDLDFSQALAYGPRG